MSDQKPHFSRINGCWWRCQDHTASGVGTGEYALDNAWSGFNAHKYAIEKAAGTASSMRAQEYLRLACGGTLNFKHNEVAT